MNPANLLSESKSKGDILGDCTVPLNFWYCKSPGMQYHYVLYIKVLMLNYICNLPVQMMPIGQQK